MCTPSVRLNVCVRLEITMAGVIQKFVTASMFMWIIPVAILYAFNNNLLPGVSDMSPYSLTLLSGFLAVISVKRCYRILHIYGNERTFRQTQA
ncbi:unnamed protein product [Malus baccata var. baccata]